jgi:hypothetical protein
VVKIGVERTKLFVDNMALKSQINKSNVPLAQPE